MRDLEQELVDRARRRRPRGDRRRAAATTRARRASSARSSPARPTGTASSDCDLVLEAVFERLDVKKEVFAELERVVAPECVLATNTSSLSVTEMAAELDAPGARRRPALLQPGRRAAARRADPDRGDRRRDARDRRTPSCKALRKRPVLVRDAPAFVVNRVLTRLTTRRPATRSSTATPVDDDRRGDPAARAADGAVGAAPDGRPAGREPRAPDAARGLSRTASRSRRRSPLRRGPRRDRRPRGAAPQRGADPRRRAGGDRGRGAAPARGGRRRRARRTSTRRCCSARAGRSGSAGSRSTSTRPASRSAWSGGRSPRSARPPALGIRPMARDDWRIRIELPEEEHAHGLLGRLRVAAATRRGGSRRSSRAGGSRSRATTTRLRLRRVGLAGRAGAARRAGGAAPRRASRPTRVQLEHWLDDEDRWDDEPPGQTWRRTSSTAATRPGRSGSTRARAARREELAEQLEAEGSRSCGSFRYVIVGAASRGEARELAQRIGGEVEAGRRGRLGDRAREPVRDLRRPRRLTPLRCRIAPAEPFPDLSRYARDKRARGGTEASREPL